MENPTPLDVIVHTSPYLLGVFALSAAISDHWLFSWALGILALLVYGGLTVRQAAASYMTSKPFAHKLPWQLYPSKWVLESPALSMQLLGAIRKYRRKGV